MHASLFAQSSASFALVIAATLPLCALASPPQPVDITIDCARPALPPQRDIARLTGIDNIGQAYDMRATLMLHARRACKRGVDEVRLVMAPVKREAALPLAKAEMPPR